MQLIERNLLREECLHGIEVGACHLVLQGLSASEHRDVDVAVLQEFLVLYLIVRIDVDNALDFLHGDVERLLHFLLVGIRVNAQVENASVVDGRNVYRLAVFQICPVHRLKDGRGVSWRIDDDAWTFLYDFRKDVVLLLGEVETETGSEVNNGTLHRQAQLCRQLFVAVYLFDRLQQDIGTLLVGDVSPCVEGLLIVAVTGIVHGFGRSVGVGLILWIKVERPGNIA